MARKGDGLVIRSRAVKVMPECDKGLSVGSLRRVERCLA